jgi:hypothetical protein
LKFLKKLYNLLFEKEDGEIHYNGDVCRVFQGSQRPQDNEYDIIGGKDQGSDAHQRSQQS